MAEVDWSKVEREVFGTLRSRRWADDQAHDLAQTAVERAIRNGVDEWSTRSAIKWCVRVAINAGIDERRKEARIDPDAEPDLGVSRDAEDVALARLELAAVAEAITQLSDRDRELVLEDGERHVTRIDQVRAAVARHRARARLRELVDKAWAWVIATTVYRRANEHVGEISIARDAVAALVVTAMSVGMGPPASTTWMAARFAGAGGATTSAVEDGTSTHARPYVEVSRRVADVADLLGEQKPDRPREGDGDPRVRIDRGRNRECCLWYWEDDDEHDAESVECVWSAAVDSAVCTPITWGDVDRVSPVPPPPTPW